MKTIKELNKVLEDFFGIIDAVVYHSEKGSSAFIKVGDTSDAVSVVSVYVSKRNGGCFQVKVVEDSKAVKPLGEEIGKLCFDSVGNAYGFIMSQANDINGFFREKMDLYKKYADG